MLMSLWTDYLSQYITADSWVLNAKDAAKLIMIAVTPSLPSKLCKHVIHFRKVRKLLKSSIMWLILSGSINSVGESEFVSISPGFGHLWSVVLFPFKLGGCPASCSLVTYKRKLDYLQEKLPVILLVIESFGSFNQYFTISWKRDPNWKLFHYWKPPHLTHLLRV